MATRFFTGLQHPDSLINRIEDLIARAFDTLVASAYLEVTVVKNQALTTSDARVYHGLGRPINGWQVVRKNANAVVYEGATSADPNNYINLKSSANVTVTLRFD